VASRAACTAASDGAIGRSALYSRPQEVRRPLGDQHPDPAGAVQLAVAEVVDDLARAPLAGALPRLPLRGGDARQRGEHGVVAGGVLLDQAESLSRRESHRALPRSFAWSPPSDPPNASRVPDP
jgi:hypothetical protein